MTKETKDDPYLDAAVRGWIVNTARRNYWRISAWYEFEDLIQDGYLCFAKCRKSYRPDPTKPVDNLDDRRTFMAYFRLAFVNHITDLANSRTSTPEVAMAGLGETQVEGLEAWTAQASELSDASLRAALASAPAEIAEMLKQILIDGVADGAYLKTRLRKKVLPGYSTPRVVRGKRKIRETTEAHFDRCLGKKGVVAALKSYFLGNEDDLIDRAVACLFKQDTPAVCINESTTPE